MMLRSTIRGCRGLVALTSYRAGDVIHRLAGRLTSFPTEESVCTDRHTHIVDPRLKGIRKTSDDPSAEVLAGTMYARRRIEVGDEITVSR